MTPPDVVSLRPVLLMVPALVLVLSLGLKTQPTAVRAGAFLAYVWQFQARLILNIVALQMGFWQFEVTGSLIYGVPVDIIIGQSLLFGPIVVLWGMSRHPVFMTMLAVTLDVFIITNVPALYSAGHDWILAVLVINLLAVIPSLLLGESTASNTKLRLRALMQAIGWICLLAWLFPSLVFENGFGSWSKFLDRSILLNLLYLSPLLAPGWILGRALYEFTAKGEGTAFPYDPPKRLVTTGIYARISNPMQLGVCLFMGYWGYVLGSFHVSLSAIVAIMLFVVFKNVCNGSSAVGRREPFWALYNNEVPKWVPRLKPWVAPRVSPANSDTEAVEHVPPP